MSKTDVPKEAGFYWVKWRIADDGTDEAMAALLPLNVWEVVEVFDNATEGSDEPLRVNVAGEPRGQSLENFIWNINRLKNPDEHKATRQWQCSEHRKMYDYFQMLGVADIHMAVAAWYFDVLPKDVTPTQRQEAKGANFLYQYGTSKRMIKGPK